MDLRHWLREVLSPQYVERTLETLDAQEVDNVKDLALFSAPPPPPH